MLLPPCGGFNYCILNPVLATEHKDSNWTKFITDRLTFYIVDIWERSNEH